MDTVPPLPPMPTRGPSAVLKVVVIGLLGICLFVPLALMWALVAERAGRRDTVVAETVSSIGKAQTVGGVVLAVPYDASEVQANGRTVTVTRHAYIHPEQLSIEATATPEIRHRSLYAVIVYRTAVKMRGTLRPPDLAQLNAQATAVHWDRASTTVEISDLRGTLAVSPLTFGDARIDLEPMNESSPFAYGIRGRTPLTPEASAPIPFAVDLTLAGSEALRFLPVGKATDVRLSSPWPDPGFSGAFLPTSRQTGAQGFQARWQVSYLARNFPHAWLDANVDRTTMRDQRQASSFGVTFVQAVDHYQQTERAVKYGLLFVLLTFTVFLLWELLRNLHLHPIQYLLIGAALVVFYLLLLSLSEHMRFGYAYGLAAAATVVLVAGYSASVLRAGRTGVATIGGWLTALYGVLYVLLQLEDVALLIGAIFVFVMLAVVMFLTRRIDWSGARVPQPV